MSVIGLVQFHYHEGRRIATDLRCLRDVMMSCKTNYVEGTENSGW